MFTLFRIFVCSILIITNSHGKRYVFPAGQSKHANILRVLGGRDVKPDEYSFVIIFVAFYLEMTRICTGAMITEHWGITAAHCKPPDTAYYAWFANFTAVPSSPDVISEVLETFPHPSYRTIDKDDMLVNNDIGLFYSLTIKVKTFARLSSVDYTAMKGLPVQYVGAGWTKPRDLSTNLSLTPLQVGEGVIVECSAEMRSKSKYLICISAKCTSKSQRPWYGDSGGPLIHENRIIGVCSFGESTINENGYTPISPYIDWIYQVIHSKDKHVY